MKRERRLRSERASRCRGRVRCGTLRKEWARSRVKRALHSGYASESKAQAKKRIAEQLRNSKTGRCDA